MNTKRKLLELNELLNSSKTIGNAKFKYAIEKNIRIIKSEVENIHILSDDINNIVKDYLVERDELIKKHGSPKDNIISIDKTDENYDVAMKELSEISIKYKDSLELYDTEFKNYQLSLDNEYDSGLIFHEILSENIPDEFNGQGLLMDFEILK